MAVTNRHTSAGAAKAGSRSRETIRKRCQAQLRDRCETIRDGRFARHPNSERDDSKPEASERTLRHPLRTLTACRHDVAIHPISIQPSSAPHRVRRHGGAPSAPRRFRTHIGQGERASTAPTRANSAPTDGGAGTAANSSRHDHLSVRGPAIASTHSAPTTTS